MYRGLLLFTASIIFLSPFVVALLLAIAAAPGGGALQWLPGTRTIHENFGPVLLGEKGNNRFLAAAGVSSQISIMTSLCAVLIATPVAERIGTRYRKNLWKIAAFALGLRVLPAATAIESFSSFQRLMELPRGSPLVITVETCVLLPMAVVMLAAGAWPELHRGETILSLDTPMSAWEHLVYRVHTIGPDLALTAGATFMLSWSDFVFPDFFLDQSSQTVSQLLVGTQGFYVRNWGAFGAMVCLAVAPPLIVVVVGVLIRFRQTEAYGGLESA